MYRTFALAAVLVALAPVAVQGATARSSSKFSVPTNHDETVAWHEANRAAVFNASNCRILEDRGGGEYQVQTNTPAGACRYIVKETREQGTAKDGQPRTIYRVKYVRNISGRLADFELTIAITGQAEHKTEFGAWIMANVSGRFVPVFAVRNVLESALSGCQGYIAQHVR